MYTTPGFVIEACPYGEAGRILTVFTRELGMIHVIAQGIRLGVSKLRTRTQLFSLSVFSFVRGRDMWRLVGAQEVEKLPMPAADISFISESDLGIDPLLVRILGIVRRLVQGEEKNEALFDAVLAFKHYREEKALLEGDVTVEHGYTFDPGEPIIMLRILNLLGYIRSNDELALFLDGTSFDQKLTNKMNDSRIKNKAIQEINTALQQSHL